MALRMGGRFLVRIEDIDTARARPEFIDGIFEDLAWLGLSWEEPVFRQSEHFADYQSTARRLDAMGLLYPCFATRTEIVAASDATRVDPDGTPHYPGRGKVLSDVETEARRRRGEPFALRLDMARALYMVRQKIGGPPLSFRSYDEASGIKDIPVYPERWGDAIIVRKDTPSSYHLSVAVDDARQGVTHITRGLDLLAATDLHRLLQVLLNLPEPLYHHHRLIADPAGRKLAKSAGDRTLAGLRAQGSTPTDIRWLTGLM